VCTNMRVETLETRVDALIAESHFSGVIRVDQAGDTLFERSVTSAVVVFDPVFA